MIGFAGLSHLGIVTSITTASKGHSVVAYDPDQSLCDMLSEGRTPISEPGLIELLTNSSGSLRFTPDPEALGECDVIYVSADISTDQDSRSDLSVVAGLVDAAVEHAQVGATLVVLSQVPPRFTRSVADIVARRRPDAGLHVYYQVETLIFGRAVERALRPERYIVGCMDPTAALPGPFEELLSDFDCHILRMRYESAELAKISINVMLASSVAAANTMAELCEAIGADWSEIVPSLRLDRRIGQHSYINPGLGLSGGNLERDLASVIGMAYEYGTDVGVVSEWVSDSRYRRDWVLRAVLSGAIEWDSDDTVGLWGIAYKPDTDSTKHSPAIDLVMNLNPIQVRAYDPKAILDAGSFPNAVQCDRAFDACQDVKALVVATPWNEFSEVDLERVRDVMEGDLIVDPFGALNADRCVELGFKYLTLGSPARKLEAVLHG